MSAMSDADLAIRDALRLMGITIDLDDLRDDEEGRNAIELIAKVLPNQMVQLAIRHICRISTEE
jgi:hypothetical protein